MAAATFLEDGAPEAKTGSSARIALIRPPAVSSLHAYSVGIVPPLGVAYVAGALESAGHRVRVIDALGEAPLARRPSAQPRLAAHGLSIAEIVARVPSDVQGIGVSVMFSQQWPHVAEMLRALREAFPLVPIFVGGEHVTAMWEYVLLSCPEVSLCALGEGEETVVDIAAWICGQRSLDDIPGIAFRVGELPQRNVSRRRLRDIDRIPRPAWHLIPLENYLSNGFGDGVHRGRSLPMLATRGCPYQCTFCSSPEMWTTRYYHRSPSSVVDEIADYVDRYAISNIDFEDLTTVIDRKWVLAFCEELAGRGLRITFQLTSGTRSEALDADVLEALWRSGCRNLTYAPESGSRRTLERIQKKVDPERVLKSMRTAKRLGVNIKSNLVIGFPEETHRDLLQTVWFGLRATWVGIDDVPLFPFSPYPGSRLYEELRRDGRLPPPNDDYFASLCYADLTQATSMSRHVGSFALNLYRVLGMIVFYLIGYARRPWRIVRSLRNIVSERTETVLEQRLVEYKRRRFRRAPRAERLLQPARDNDPGPRASIEPAPRPLNPNASAEVR